MTVTAQIPLNSYLYAGSSAFAFGFRILDAADLVVQVDGVVRALGTDYTVSGVGSAGGGVVTYLGTLTTGQLITINRSTDLTRSTDYQQNGDFLSPVVNTDFDRLWMALQDLQLGVAIAVGDAAAAVAASGATPVSGSGGSSLTLIFPVVSNNLATALPPDEIIYGGQIAWASGLTFTVQAAAYRINGVVYNSPASTVTLATADPTNPRIDTFVFTTSSTVAVVLGTAAAVPVKTSTDPNTQIEGGVARVEANATSALGTTITQTIIYRQNAEWVVSQISGSPFNVASTNNPRTGTLCIETLAPYTVSSLKFQAPGPIDVNSQTSLTFWIRSKATWSTSYNLRISLRLNNSVRGSTVLVGQGRYGFDTRNTSTYQQITIPISDFRAFGSSFDSIYFAHTGGPPIPGFYLDDIELQGFTTQQGEGGQGIPLTYRSTAYTLGPGDANSAIVHPSADTAARTWTIPSNAAQPYPVGTAVTFVNQNGAGVITIGITTDTMRLAGAGTTGNRTLAANGQATALKITPTEWQINGVGLA